MNIIIFCITFSIFIKYSIGQNYLSYVCHSISDYTITRAKNQNCYYNGDVLNSFEEIAEFYGYNTEVFEVVTEDQYILKIFRISPKNSSSVGAPVLLAHGSITASTVYTLVGNRSLAFLLADEGYDVWVSNFRGTSYSKNHKFLNYHDKKFWDFTFHEYGIYDLKSIINLVTSTSKQKVIYIGWSIGPRVYYIYNIMNPDEAIRNVRVSISLGPTVYPNLTRSLYIKVIELIPNWILQGTLNTLFPEGVFYYKTPTVIKSVLHFCFDSPFQFILCAFAKGQATGFNIQHDAPETCPVLAAHITEPTGLKMFYHDIQLAKSKKFQQFDYGKTANLIRYGSPYPPLYNFSLINLPNHIIYGSNDFIASEENVKLIYHNLPEVAKPFGEPYRVKDEHFGHLDMIASKDIKPLLNDYIITFLKENQVYFNN